MNQSNASEISDFRLPSVRLDKPQLQVWVDNGWTKPGTPGAITDILLQFYTADPVAAYSNMQLIAYPRQANGSVYVDGKVILAIDTSVEGLLLVGPAIFGNNQITLASLEILNEDGTLNDFEYLMFTPERYTKDPEYINYIVVVVKPEQNKQMAAVESSPTWPCPPYCGEPD